MKEKIISILFIAIIYTLSISTLILKDRDISTYERRKLTTTQKLKENFIDNLDDYLTDQFVFRDSLISINSCFDRYILKNIDDNNVYILNDYIIEKNYPLKEENIENFIKKINYIKDNYLKDNSTYYTIIPDKSYFLNSAKYLKFNYSELFEKLKENINASYIDITNLLELEDYYKTDIHIKQTSYPKIIKELITKMNFNYKEINYKENKIENFYGASYSKVPQFIKPDEIVYMTDNNMNDLHAQHLEYGEKNIYDLEKLNTSDKYNIFLSGPSSLIEIKNEDTKSNKELIIFRDSFGSSFAPLLTPYYKRIILIDLRYINMDIVNEYIDFENKDILFAYSTLIVNESNLLKVNMK